MTRCPACGSTEVRTHATRYSLWWERRWRWFGPVVPRYAPRAVECSCGPCLYAFVVWPDRIEAAPVQKAYDSLAAAQKAVVQAPAPELEKKKPPPAARPAPDPRVRKR
jgi:hypothetical protein